MEMTPTGIAIPIRFSTNKLTRKTAHCKPKPVVGYIEIFFSPAAIKLEQIDLAQPGKAWTKAAQTYRKHHIYGDHQFLVPISHEKIGSYEAPWGKQYSFDQIGNNPTTAVYQEAIQLRPCSMHNLKLIVDNHQTEPFFIEITNESFFLYVQDQGTYWKIPSQRYSPNCWGGFAHPVITMETTTGSSNFHRRTDIPWSAIAQQLGSEMTQIP